MTAINNNYKNPLDDYRSYSYHFILTVSSTTEAYREMIGSGDTRAPLLDSVMGAKKLGDEFKIGNQSAYLLVDTRRFSQYSITNVDADHIFGTGSRVNPTTPVSTLDMIVKDTTGMSFFNTLMEVFKEKLQTTRSSAFFLLTIFFVGHKDDGTTETISTCFIPLILLSMGWEFTSSGSTYNMSFMEVESVPSRGSINDNMNSLGQIKSISTEKSSVTAKNTVGALCDTLEELLNRQSLSFYQRYVNSAAQSNSSGQYGKLVQYMITMSDEWRNFKVDAAARSKNTEQLFKAENNTLNVNNIPANTNITLTTTGDYVQMAFSSNVTITDAVKSILESSEEFLELASNERLLKGTAQAFKTSMNVTCDDETYIVHIDIFPFSLPRITSTESDSQQNIQAQQIKPTIATNNVDEEQIRNLITYDYVFTGFNSHIESLSIKYEPTSVIALDTNQMIGKNAFAYKSSELANQKVNESIGENDKKTTSFNPDIRPNDPIFPPLISVDQRNNAGNSFHEAVTPDQAISALRKKQEYRQTYSQLHFLSTLQVDMTIRGNPNLIKKYADRAERQGIAPHGMSIRASDYATSTNSVEDSFRKLNNELTSAKTQYKSTFYKARLAAAEKTLSRSSDSLLNGTDVTVHPVLVKLNIKAPNVDSTGNYIDAVNEPMFTDKFFFNGYYNILTMHTSFNDGQFNHTLTLMPWSVVDDSLNPSKSAKLI